MLFILNQDLQIINVLSMKNVITKGNTVYFDDYHTQMLSTGAETFEFKTIANSAESENLVVGNYIAFREDEQDKLFNIIETTETKSEEGFIKQVYCEMHGIELKNSIVRPTKVLNASPEKFAMQILEDTDWEIGKVDDIGTLLDINIENHMSVYDAIQKYIVEEYGMEIYYTVDIQGNSVIKKYLNIVESRGFDNGLRFTYDKNIQNIERTIDVTDICTALIGVGNDGLTFKSVQADDKPLNQDYIESEDAYKQWSVNGYHIFGYEKFETDSPQELLRLTRKKLEERCNPKVKYSLGAELLDDNAGIGDYVRITDMDFEPPITLSARVSTLVRSKTDINGNSCEISNFKELKSNITQQMRDLASSLKGYADKLSIDNINKGGYLTSKIETVNNKTLRINNKIEKGKDFCFEFKHLTAQPVLTNFQFPTGSVMQQCLIDYHENKMYMVYDETGNGDMVIHQTNMSGSILGKMTLNKFGHGNAMGLERRGSKSYIWCECDGKQASSSEPNKLRGTKICYFEFKDGVTATSTYGTVIDILPNWKALSVAIDDEYNQLAVKGLDKIGGTYYYHIYDLKSVINGSPKLLKKFKEVGNVGTSVNQGFDILGRYIYKIQGAGYYTHPPTMDSYVTCIDTQTGKIRYTQLIDILPDMTYREIEGIKVIKLSSTKYELQFGMVSEYKTPRKNHIFKYTETLSNTQDALGKFVHPNGTTTSIKEGLIEVDSSKKRNYLMYIVDGERFDFKEGYSDQIILANYENGTWYCNGKVFEPMANDCIIGNLNKNSDDSLKLTIYSENQDSIGSTISGSSDAITYEDGKLVVNAGGLVGVLPSDLLEVEGIKTHHLTADSITADKIQANSITTKHLKTDVLEAVDARIENATIVNATIENLKATNAEIENLKANKAEIEDLKATNANIQNLEAENAKINTALIGKAEIHDLNAVKISTEILTADVANVKDLVAEKASIEDLKATNADIENLNANKANISELNAVEANIQTLNADFANVKDLVAEKASIEDLKATNANIENLNANKANVYDLNAVKAHVETLNADVANVGELVANKADINELSAIKADVGSLKADVAEIGQLKADVADIDNILAGNITADNIASGTITAGSGIIADGAIGSAQISSLDASKISAGTVDTSKVTIQGADGHLKIKGNRLQVFQGIGNQAIERVSLGDVNGNGSLYGLRVRGADGKTVLLDENGVTNEGITNGSITNEKINDDANIDGAKLNINSVISKINKDGTETIEGTKIEVDGTSLTAKLSTITNKQTTDSEKITQAQSQITANTNAIKLKVDEQTYTTDKKDMTTKLEKNTSEISAMKGQIALKVEKTDIENAINNIQVGGRNLAKNSIVVVHSGSLNKDNYISSGTLITSITGTHQGFRFDNKSIYEPDKKYVLSFNIQKQSGTINQLGMTHNGKGLKNITVFCDGVSKGDFKNANTSVGTILNDGKNHKIEVYFTTPATIPEDTGVNYTYIQLNKETGTACSAKISNFKLEEGTKPSSWTPAPEDVSSEIDTKINTAKSEIKITTDAITQNVTKLSTTVSNKADGSTVNTINNKVGSLETSVNGISGKVTNLEKTTTDLGTSVSGVQGEVSTLKSNVASLEISTSGISQKVSSVESTTKTLTTQVGTANTNATNALNKANSANTLADSKAKVFATTPTVPYKIGDLWVQGTSGDVMRCKTTRTSGSYTASDWEKASKYTDDTKANAVDGKVNNLQSEYESTKSQVAEIVTDLDGITQRVSSTESKTSSLTEKVGTAQSTANSAKSTADSANTAINNLAIGGTNIATKTNQGVTGWDLSLQTGGRTISEVTENGIKCCKIVRDNVASTGWNYIKYSYIGREKYLPNKKYTVSFEVKSSVVTSFNVQLMEGNASNKFTDTIKTGNTVANTWTKLSATITTTATLPSSTSQVLYLSSMNVNTGTSYIFRNLKIEEGTKPSSWTPAPEDVAKDATDKANQALSDAKEYTNTEIKTTNNKVSELKSDLSGITSKVSSAETNITAIKNQASQDRQNIRCNELGAKINYSTFTTANAGEIYIHGYDANNNPTDTNGYIYWNGAKVSVTKGMINPNSDFGTTDCYICTFTTGGNSFVIYWNTTEKKWKYKHVLGSSVGTTGNVSTSANYVVYGQFRMKDAETFDYAYLYTTPLKLENAIGISTLDSRLTTAESKITDTSITNVVKQNFYTKEETNTQITSKGYQTSSQVQQTVDKLELKFQESGGYNLLYNSNFRRGIEKWSITSGFAYSIGSGTWSSKDRCGIRLTGKTGLDGYLAQSITESTLINGSKYTLSGYVYISSSGTNDASGANFQLYCRITYTDGTMEYSHCTINKTLYDKWQKVSTTFSRNASKTVQDIRVNLSVHKTTKYFYGSQIMLEAGETVTAWSPNPNETYDGITTIDKDGITVTSSNVKSKTNMSANGFKITKTDTNEDVFKVNSDGTLAIKGNITVTGGSIPTANLSGTISSSQLHSTVTGDISTAKSNASSALTTINNNKSNWDNAFDRVKEWASGAVTGTTTINGGLIATDTITAKHISLGDFNNYCQLAKGKKLTNRYGTATWLEGTSNNSYWYSSDKYFPFTINETVNPFKAGDKVQIKFDAHTPTTRDVSVGIWFYSDNACSTNIGSVTGTVSCSASWLTKTVNLTLPTGNTYVQSAKSVAILINNGTSGEKINVRNVTIIRQVAGDLIVNGTITGDKIVGSTITGDKIQAGTISADKLSVQSRDSFSVNPNFGNWTSTYPYGTSAWNDGGISKVQVDLRYVPQFTVSTVTSQQGMNLGSSFFNKGLNLDGVQYIGLESKFRLTSGTNPAGACMLLYVYFTDGTIEKLNLSFKSIFPTVTTNTWYTAKRVFKLANIHKTYSSIKGYLLANYSTETNTVKTIQFASANAYVCTEQDYLTQSWTTGTEINGAYIKTGTLSANKITTGTLDATKANVINLKAENITSGTISADRISTATLKGKTIEGGVITSTGTNGDYTTIQGGYIESYGTISRSWLGTSEGNQTIKLKSENGKFRARNDSLDRSVYFSDRGLSTTKDGNVLSSGIVDFHNEWYGYGRKGIAMYSNNDVGLIARNGFINISPEWVNAGNNTFSFQVQDSTDTNATHGLIYYGSHKNGYGTLLRLGKSSTEPYLQVLGDGYTNTGTLKAYKTSTTMFNNNYCTTGTITINKTSAGATKGTQTYLTGTTISATNIYQNGSSVSGSDIVLKDNIKEFNNALDIIEKTKVYEFNRILANQDKKEIGFLAQDVPDELLFDKGTITKEEVENLNATEKRELLERKTLEQKELRKREKLEELSKKMASFHDLSEEETEQQINEIMEEYNNVEYEVPISTINQNNVIGVMFQAIKEQQELIKKLENRIVELEKKID